MGSDVRGLMSDGGIQIVKTSEVIGVTQPTEGELIIEVDGRVESTVVTGASWLKVATSGIAKCTQYGNNGTLSVSDGATATDIIRPEGGAISFSTLAAVNGRHPEGEFSADRGYAYGLLLENNGNLCVLEGHRAGKIILDREDGLLVNGTTSAVVVDEGGELLVYPGGEINNCEINQDGVFMLTGKANDTLLAGGIMSNLGGKGSDTTVEDRFIYRLGMDGPQPYNSGKTRNLSVSIGGWTRMHTGTLENAVIQGGTVILLSPISTDGNFVVERDRTPVELTGSVALLNGTPMIIGYGTKLQQSTITVQQGSVLILDDSTVKGDSIIPIAGDINLNDGKLWPITDAAARVQLKVKRLREEGTIYLQASAKEISPDSINVKGEVIEDVHAEITDASRQTLYNALELQPDEDGIGATLQPV